MDAALGDALFLPMLREDDAVVAEVGSSCVDEEEGLQTEEAAAFVLDWAVNGFATGVVAEVAMILGRDDDADSPWEDGEDEEAMLLLLAVRAFEGSGDSNRLGSLLTRDDGRRADPSCDDSAVMASNEDVQDGSEATVFLISTMLDPIHLTCGNNNEGRNSKRRLVLSSVPEPERNSGQYNGALQMLASLRPAARS